MRNEQAELFGRAEAPCLFDVQAPTAADWAIAVLYAIAVFVVLEVGKFLTSRQSLPNKPSAKL
jgi:hypothetical protein